MQSTPKFITAEQLAEILCVSRNRIYKLTMDGKVPHIKIGRSTRFNIDDVLTHLGYEEKQGLKAAR